MTTSPMWRPTPDGPAPAGDHFGDDEACDALVVTYHLDGVANARVSVYFGVILAASSGRYAPVSETVFEVLNENGDVTDEENHPESERFPYDYEVLDQAMEGMKKEAQRWQNTTWSKTDFFDGVNVH